MPHYQRTKIKTSDPDRMHKSPADLIHKKNVQGFKADEMSPGGRGPKSIRAPRKRRPSLLRWYTTSLLDSINLVVHLLSCNSLERQSGGHTLNVHQHL